MSTRQVPCCLVPLVSTPWWSGAGQGGPEVGSADTLEVVSTETLSSGLWAVAVTLLWDHGRGRELPEASPGINK